LEPGDQDEKMRGSGVERLRGERMTGEKCWKNTARVSNNMRKVCTLGRGVCPLCGFRLRYFVGFCLLS
jgi:hypothetical protein